MDEEAQLSALTTVRNVVSNSNISDHVA